MMIYWALINLLGQSVFIVDLVALRVKVRKGNRGLVVLRLARQDPSSMTPPRALLIIPLTIFVATLKMPL